MAGRTVNILISSSGLGLPSTLVLPLPQLATLDELWDDLGTQLSHIDNRLTLTTTFNTQLPCSSAASIATYLSTPEDDFLPLRLTVPVLGGKGGFGSQLRAAGGRMSSKRKKNQGDDNGSSRNLDGRRMRTVTEAKALAEYLAIKPDMEKKEKEKRRQRWEQIVEMAEKREEEIKYGNKGRLDGKWVEAKEEAGERTRDAVLAVLKSGDFKDNLLSTSGGRSSAAASDEREDSDEMEEDESPATMTPSSPAEAQKPDKGKPRVFFGFDDDDEFMSSDEDEEAAKPKGKEKAAV